MYRCLNCGRLFIGSDSETECPYCGSQKIEQAAERQQEGK